MKNLKQQSDAFYKSIGDTPFELLSPIDKILYVILIGYKHGKLGS